MLFKPHSSIGGKTALALAHISNVAQCGYFLWSLELLNTLSWSQSYSDSFINIPSHQSIQLANTHRRATLRCLTGSLKSLEGAANQWSQGREGGPLPLRRNLTSRDVRDQLTIKKKTKKTWTWQWPHVFKACQRADEGKDGGLSSSSQYRGTITIKWERIRRILMKEREHM